MLVGQAVAPLHQQLDRIREVLLGNVMSAALGSEAVSQHEHIDISESIRRLELVTRKLDSQTIRILQIERVHEAAVALVK